jgi:hypothetical protein
MLNIIHKPPKAAASRIAPDEKMRTVRIPCKIAPSF